MPIGWGVSKIWRDHYSPLDPGTTIQEDVIADTVPDRKLPFAGGPPLFGLAFIGLACAGLLGLVVLRRAIRRP